MSARIVAQIDSLLARLIAARELLASTLNAGTEAQPGRVVTMEARESSEAVEDVPATPVQVTVLKPRGRRERRSVARPLASVATALAGSIPERPVAVSPRQLAEARESRAPEETKGPAAPRSAIEELMLEIAQRSA